MPTANVPSPAPTLWATASKEWVIQPKPKPGRKPKQDVSPIEDEQVDSGGRRVQNRAAQRAFRERKQTQLAELQARVQSYEQGEVERNVQLQNIAKRLKEENEELRLENTRLKEKIAKVDQERESSSENDKKRWRDGSPHSESISHTNKKSRVSPGPPRTSQSAASHCSSPSMASSPSSYQSSETSFSPLPFDTRSDPNQPCLPDFLDLSSNVKPLQMSHTQSFTCGFCSENTPCLCREIAVQQVAEDLGFKPDDYRTNDLDQTSSIHLEPHSARHTSILDNLPPYQPPIPLRSGLIASNLLNPMFVSALPLTQQRTPPANCSGEPSNCAACAADAFGKAFCTAIQESMTTHTPCADCPRMDSSGFNHDKSISGANTTCCIEFPRCNCGPSVSIECELETMPTNDAWRQLKSHPNVAFADLSLLAEVVARRSKCTGPEVVISPALGAATPDRLLSPRVSPSSDDPVLLTDPHAHYHEKERTRSQSNGPSSPALVQQDILVQCSRKKVCEVRTEDFRAALRLLDAKFS